MAVTLVVEDGTGKSTANSYNTLAGADAILEEIYYLLGLSAAPSGLDDESVISGTAYLDNIYGGRWKGVRTNEDQSLDWPRSGVVDFDGYTYDGDEMATALLQAHAVASYYANTDAANLRPPVSTPGAIKRKKEKVAVLEEEVEYAGSASQQKAYPIIADFIKVLLKSGNRAGRM